MNEIKNLEKVKAKLTELLKKGKEFKIIEEKCNQTNAAQLPKISIEEFKELRKTCETIQEYYQKIR